MGVVLSAVILLKTAGKRENGMHTDTFLLTASPVDEVKIKLLQDNHT